MADDSCFTLPILSRPGCKRDGTVFDGDFYSDMTWCRSQRQRPRKMGGYRALSNLLTGISRGVDIFNKNNYTYVHSGYSSGLEQFRMDMNGNVSAITDRTPAAFASNTNNIWQFDQLYNSSGSSMSLIAHAAPNATDIASDTATSVYYGDITGAGALTVSGLQAVSGGVVVLHPYLFTLGSDGIVEWTAPNDPSTGSDSARITASKLVRGLPLRAGAGNAPAGMLWSLDSLLRVTFVGGSAVFNFDTISSETSILSASSVIEYNGVYYWIGVDQFLMFNGVLRELPNDMNENFFFDNVNYAYRNRIFAFKVPRFGEIWWCYPRGNATECTHAVIYNVDESELVGYPVWYDTALPNGGRSAAQYAQVFRRPFMTGVAQDSSSSKYVLWEHEFGVDEINSIGAVAAINSSFRTSQLCMRAPPTGGQGTVTSMELERIEPDFVQSGDMTVTAYGQWNARSPTFAGDTQTFTASDTNTVPYRLDAGLMSFEFGSNVQGGSYQMGKPLAHLRASGSNRVNP